MITVLILVIIVMVAIGVFLMGTWKIKATERAIMMRFGKMTAVVESGLRFWYPRGIYEVVRYPTIQLVLAYTIEKPVTRKGWYYSDEQKRQRLKDQKDRILNEIEKTKDEMVKQSKWQDFEEIKEELAKVEDKLKNIKEEKSREKKEQEEGVEFCESVEIEKLTLGVYLRYPKGNDLRETHQALGRPMTQEELRDHFESYIAYTYREVVGELPWRVIVENKYYIAREMKRRFSEPDSPLMVAKFDIEGASIILGEVDLPDRLAELLNLPQQEELKARAAERVADRLDREIGYGIGRAAKTLEETYKFPREKAQDIAAERHGDILAAREGDFKRIQWITKGGSSGGTSGGTSTGIGLSPETIAQAMTIYETLKKAPTREVGEGKKKEEKAEIDEERVRQEAEERIRKQVKEVAEEIRKEREGLKKKK